MLASTTIRNAPEVPDTAHITTSGSIPLRLKRLRDPEDICRWADGTEAKWEDVARGEYDWMSDDFEVIPWDEYLGNEADRG